MLKKEKGVKQTKMKKVKMKQLNLLPETRPYFGGSLNFKRSARPLSIKRPIHLVLKAHRSVAKKPMDLYKNKEKINQIIQKQAQAFGIKLYGFSIQRDHIHFNIKIASREMYKRFIRAVTGLIVRDLKVKGLWKLRPFTRVTEWGRAFQTLKTYILQNELEVKNLIPKQPRKYRYKEHFFNY